MQQGLQSLHSPCSSGLCINFNYDGHVLTTGNLRRSGVITTLVQQWVWRADNDRCGGCWIVLVVTELRNILAISRHLKVTCVSRTLTRSSLTSHKASRFIRIVIRMISLWCWRMEMLNTGDHTQHSFARTDSGPGSEEWGRHLASAECRVQATGRAGR